MKRLFALILALAMLCPLLAQADGGATETLMQCFQGLSGNVKFVLPGTPVLLYDVETPGYLTNSRQLFGHCYDDDAEFQLRGGDIAGMIEMIQADYPDQPEKNVRLNALMSYAGMVPVSYGAELDDYTASYDPDNGSVLVEFFFTYPDTPDVQYYGKATLEGTWATSLILEDCPHAQKVLDSMVFLREATAEAYRESHSERTQANVHGLTMTFPCAPTAIPLEDGMERLSAFSLDWCLMDVQYQPLIIAIKGEDEEVMKSVAEKVLLPTVDADEILNPVLSRFPDGTLQLDFEAETSMMAMGNAYGNRHFLHCRVIAGEGGLWSIVTDDSETGEAFLASMTLNGKTAQAAAQPEEKKATATDLGNATTATDLPVDESKAPVANASFLTFIDLITGLNEGLDPDRFGVGVQTESLGVSEAYYSGDRWVRVIYPADISIGVALVYTNGPELDDDICEVRVLDGGSSPNMMAFARLCAWSLFGGEEELADLYADETPVTVKLNGGSATAGYTDHPHSQLAYSWVSIVPDIVPAMSLTIPEPGEDDLLEDITSGSVTRAEFEANMGVLLPFLGLSEMELEEAEDAGEDGFYHLYYVAGCLIQVWTETDAETDPVTFVVILGEPDNAPLVFGLTMTAFVAVTGGDEEALTAVAMLLTETPLWDELYDLWPLLSDGEVACILMEEDYILEWYPEGIVFKAPAAK